MRGVGDVRIGQFVIPEIKVVRGRQTGEADAYERTEYDCCREVEQFVRHGVSLPRC